MKNVKTIGLIGDILLVLGSALYLLELAYLKTEALTPVICVLYVPAVVLKLIHWFGTREERAAAKAAAKEARKAEKA